MFPRAKYYRIPPWEATPAVTLPARTSHEDLTLLEQKEIEELDPLFYWPDDQLARHLIALYVG
jgi:hypothetical protein